MADELVPDEVRKFILRHIDSVAELEALLLLRANAGEGWDAARMAKRLYIAEQEAAEVLARLCADRFLRCDEGAYRYAAQPEGQTIIDRLAEVYAKHLIPVTNIIHAKPRRIREFADAFRFRKDR